MSLVSERDGFFGWRQVDDPYSLEERGWVEDVGSTGSYYPLPRWLVYMCMGGWNEPIRGWTGGLYEKHCYCRSAHHRDGWDGVVLDSEPLYYDEFADGGRYRFRSVDPMISRFGLRGVAVRAPFPLTVDLNLFQSAACSVGELAWTPYADLRNGSCSKRMLDLMNTFPHKPGFFVYKGYLYAWINRMLQAGREPHVAMHCALEPYTELELFRAYRVYYEQLQREIPAPCMGDIVWPDQCDPRFPLENDPRAAHYGMWVYSGGLSYGGKTS